MIEVININEVEPGDLLLVESAEREKEKVSSLSIMTVESVTEDGLLIFEELGGLDYSPENQDQLIRVGRRDYKVELVNYKR